MTNRRRRLTTTGGSDEREPRSLVAPLLGFKLWEEGSRLRAESAFVDGDRNARTLVKAGAFRLVLVAFRTGATFDEADQRGTVALHVLEGRLAVHVAKTTIEVAEDEVAVVSPEQPWAASALSDGLLLIHLSWPPEAGSIEGR